MRLALLLISIILLLCCGYVSATEVTYRVSGIVGQENRWLFAVIEDSAGSCRVYTKGDMLGNWLIVGVTPQGVLVDAAGETRLLRLEGGSFIALRNETDKDKVKIPPLIASTRPVQGKLTQQEMQLAINNIADELGRSEKKQIEPQVLNAILGFAPQTIITAVNERPVKNTRETINTLKAALNGNMPVDFTLSEGGGVTKIYFRFSGPTAPPPHE